MDSTPETSRASVLRAGAAAALGAALVVGIGAALGTRTDEGLAVLFRDVHASADAPLYFGVLNGFAVMLWTSAAALGFAAAALSGPGRRSLPLGSGALALLFGCDDLFQFHDGALLLLGIPEKGIYLGYALAVVALVAWHRRQLLREHDGLLLLAALACLGASVVVDLVAESVVLSAGVDAVRIIAEDGIKTLGAALWVAFEWRLLRRLVPGRSAVER